MSKHVKFEDDEFDYNMISRRRRRRSPAITIPNKRVKTQSPSSPTPVINEGNITKNKCRIMFLGVTFAVALYFYYFH